MKRLIAPILLLLALAAPAVGMTVDAPKGRSGKGVGGAFSSPGPGITVGISTGLQVAGATVISSTPPATIAAGSYVFVSLASDSGQPTTVFDDGGNVYKQYVQQSDGYRAMIYVASNTAAPTNWVQANFAGSGNRAIAIVPVTGLSASTGTVGVTTVTANNFHVTTTTMTLSSINQIAMCAFVPNPGNTSIFTPGNGFTIVQTMTGSTNLQLVVETRIGSVDTPCDINWSVNFDSLRGAGTAWK